jgi:hypothetical protein
MADLEPFKAMLKNRPSHSDYDRSSIPAWDVAERALSAALDDAVVARREAEAMREQMTAQARHVAELEFEVARLTRQAQMIRVSSEPERFAWDDPRSHRECSHDGSIAAYRKCLAENMAAATPTEEN